jgi:UDP-2,3-diacylglucosamine pyrophosphatase LpxH
MHWGIADMDYYRDTLEEILAIITSKHWDKILILVGQDLFHNDSIVDGKTTKGTPIEKVNLKRAVYDATTFYFNLIDTALKKANSVQVIYSPGNHDKTVGWFFAYMLKVRYGDIVDDSTDERKVVWWNGCFIGITHGDKKADSPQGLMGNFATGFPELFASAKVREIHTGHLHNEISKDMYGVQVRRMSTGNKDDEWTIGEGYRSKKRFMLFEWRPNKLKAIYYV